MRTRKADRMFTNRSLSKARAYQCYRGKLDGVFQFSEGYTNWAWKWHETTYFFGDSEASA